MVSFRRRSRSIEFDRGRQEIRFGSGTFFFNKQRDQAIPNVAYLWDVLGSGFLSSRFL